MESDQENQVPKTLLMYYLQKDPETFFHSDEVQKERLKNREVTDEIQIARLENKDLRYSGVWTADFPLCVVEGKEPVLYIARRDNNLVLHDLDNAVKQILETGNYKPSNEYIEKVVKAETTLRIPILELELAPYCMGESSFFKFDPSRYDKLNSVQRAFAERVHGSGEQFGKTMKMLTDYSIRETRIRAFNADYVREEAKNGAIVSSTCRLQSLNDNSDFVTCCKYVPLGDEYISR